MFSQTPEQGSIPRPGSLRLHSRRTGAVLAQDSDLGKWQAAESVSFAGRPLGGQPRRATVYTLWDPGYLDLCFDVHSSKLQAVVREHDGDRLWMDDGVEFLIDARRDRTRAFLPDDFPYHINILNAVYDDRGTPEGDPRPSWNGIAQHSVKVLDDCHYLVEIAVPWSEIGLAPEEDRTILGADFCVNGRDPESGEYDYFDWCGLKVFHDPSGFGDLILVGTRAV